jgi:aromatic-L-amino-acid decarboxylase
LSIVDRRLSIEGKATLTDDVFMEGSDATDPYLTTMQWSRRAIGLKVFMTLAECGAEGLAARIDRQARMGDRLRSRLRDSGWVVVNDTALPVVCFTHEDIRSGRLTTTAVLDAIYARGHVWISDVVPGGRERVLRACITSFQTEEGDLEALISELEHARRTAGIQKIGQMSTM